jgi:mannose-6-phosphate isomerase
MLTDFIIWIADTALPFWAERGFDAEHGRFRERLDFAACPLPVPHRAMVQARQIFVFAHAAEQGWNDRAGELAETAMTSLLRDFAQTESDETSFAFSIDPASGAVVSPIRDAYAHAFLLFSIAALYRLNGNARLLDLADRTINFIDRRLTDPVHGGLYDALPAPAEKRQNPHMHLLEAYLFLERAAPGRGYIERAQALVRLFRRHFFREGLLLEYFQVDWAVAERAAWEPGHHFEWVWLLGEYGALTGEDLGPEMDALHAAAMRHGLTDEGLILDELSPRHEVLKASRRVWPHTEAIKAAATRHAGGEAGARNLADAMAAALLQHFLDRPFAGGWVDHLAADGAPLVDYVPASSLYHLALAASVAARGFAAAPALAKAAT